MEDEIKKDAARWAYIRDNLVQSHSIKMNGEHSYRFRTFRQTGPNFTEAIDKAIEESEKEKFEEHIKWASEKVATWPKWKQNMLGRTSDENNS